MNELITGPIYDEVIFSREVTPEAYALFAKLFSEPQEKKPMTRPAPWDHASQCAAVTVSYAEAMTDRDQAGK